MRAPVTRIPFNELFDAALASQILENLSASECTKAIDCLYACLKPKGVLFALFNPYMTPEQLVTIKSSDNPTKEATFVNYTDEELLGLFQENFVLLDQKNYSDGTRLLRLRARATD